MFTCGGRIGSRVRHGECVRLCTLVLESGCISGNKSVCVTVSGRGFVCG